MKLIYKIIIFLLAVVVVEWSYLAYKGERIEIRNGGDTTREISLSTPVAQELPQMRDKQDNVRPEEDAKPEDAPLSATQEQRDAKPEDAPLSATQEQRDADSHVGENDVIRGGKEDEIIENISFNVPFTSQAPYAEWSNPVHQDGCEEASSLMAVAWAREEKLGGDKAKSEIIAASDYQTKNYGEYRDTSALDTTERIIKGYFGYEDVEVKNSITLEDIILELEGGSLIILPMDGQRLNNIYYTPPGPERHMIVVTGYDKEAKEFITNDPGTRRGENYRYSEKILFDAIRDYSTGYHVPIQTIEKNMIVVSRGE